MRTIQSMQQPQIRYTRTSDGARIAYYAMGEGPPLVVVSEMQWSHLGHTLGMREYYRSRSGKGLGRGLTVVRYDARGTGLSDRGTIDFSWDARRRDLEAVMDALRLKKAVLFGHMHASVTAVQFAAEEPERVTKLVLVNPYARGWEHRPVAEFAGVTMLTEMTRLQWQKYTETIANLTVGFDNPRLAGVIANYYRDSMSPASHQAFLDWREKVDVTAFLSRVRAPTLVIQRQREDTPSLGLEVAERIPGARVVPIYSEGPMRNVWRDEETAAIEEFLGIPPEGAPSEYALTPREREVLTQLAAGRSNREIAETLLLSERTVSRHIANLYTKLGVHTRAAATALALKERLVDSSA